jgi:hypothetical protein
MTPEMVTTSTTAGDPSAPIYTIEMVVPESELIKCYEQKIQKLEEGLRKEEEVSAIYRNMAIILFMILAVTLFRIL